MACRSRTGVCNALKLELLAITICIYQRALLILDLACLLCTLGHVTLCLRSCLVFSDGPDFLVICVGYVCPIVLIML